MFTQSTPAHALPLLALVLTSRQTKKQTTAPARIRARSSRITSRLVIESLDEAVEAETDTKDCKREDVEVYQHQFVAGHRFWSA